MTRHAVGNAGSRAADRATTRALWSSPLRRCRSPVRGPTTRRITRAAQDCRFETDLTVAARGSEILARGRSRKDPCGGFRAPCARRRRCSLRQRSGARERRCRAQVGVHATANSGPIDGIAGPLTNRADPRLPAVEGPRAGRHVPDARRVPTVRGPLSTRLLRRVTGFDVTVLQFLPLRGFPPPFWTARSDLSPRPWRRLQRRGLSRIWHVGGGRAPPGHGSGAGACRPDRRSRRRARRSRLR
jgi:hypothetical protein